MEEGRRKIEEEKRKKEEVVLVKKGRKKKGEVRVFVLNMDQSKFFVDLAGDKKSLESVFNLLVKANKKSLGREITFKDLAVLGISKITEKDIESLKEESLTEMEKVERALVKYNSKSGTKLSLGEFLVKKLALN